VRRRCGSSDAARTGSPAPSASRDEGGKHRERTTVGRARARVGELARGCRACRDRPGRAGGDLAPSGLDPQATGGRLGLAAGDGEADLPDPVSGAEADLRDAPKSDSRSLALRGTEGPQPGHGGRRMRTLALHPRPRGGLERSRRALLRRSPDGPLVPGGLRLLPLRTKGTADNWLPLEQMWTAEKALRAGRGFYPGPRPPASAASCSGPFAPAPGLTSATPFSARSSGQGLKARPCSAVPASARMRPRGQPFRPERSRSDRAARRASFQATSGV
jgi:hypothetical protein